MPRPHGLARQAGSLLVAAGILLATLLIAALNGPGVAAEPAAQVQPQSSPAPRATNTPKPTLTPAEELAELQQRKLNREIRLLDVQIDRMRQQEDIDGQAWRAPATAVASFGPTLVGLGLLYLLARALSHWLPAARPPATRWTRKTKRTPFNQNQAYPPR